MKTKSWILLILAVLLPCLALSIWILRPQPAADFAEISSFNQVVKTVDLHKDQQFTVTTEEGGENTITVQDGKIAVTAATCPDHYCMERGFCSSGTQIVCLPNKLVIRFLAEQTVDGVVG